MSSSETESERGDGIGDTLDSLGSFDRVFRSQYPFRHSTPLKVELMSPGEGAFSGGVKHLVFVKNPFCR